MPEKSIKVLHVSTSDLGGGAEKICWSLSQALRKKGHVSWTAVGRKKQDDPTVFAIPKTQNHGLWSQSVGAAQSCVAPLVGRVRGVGRIHRFLGRMTDRHHFFEWLNGREHVHFPGTKRLLDLPPERPDIVHCHNLHGGYFDYRELAEISKNVPVVMTLHDEWTFTGHCAYTMGCERWKTGCGDCPSLFVYPAIRKDGSAENWQAKQAVYENSRLHIATPSQWLMDQVEQSMLSQAMVEGRVINNGVDLNVFQQRDKAAARKAVGIDDDVMVLLFTANHARNSIFKDYGTVHDAALQVAQHMQGRKLLLLAVGDVGPSETIGTAEFRFIPFQADPRVVADYYNAADVYLHAARAENYPTTILEAMACGLPAVGTDVGGIGEQIYSLRHTGVAQVATESFAADQATGLLVGKGDSAGMAQAAQFLLENTDILQQLSQNASKVAKDHFSELRMADDYLDWYTRILAANSKAVMHEEEASHEQ